MTKDKSHAFSKLGTDDLALIGPGCTPAAPIPGDRAYPLGISKISCVGYSPISAQSSDLSRLALGTLGFTGY